MVFDLTLSRLTIAIKKSANAAKVKIANTRSSIDDSIVTPNASSFEIITFTENMPKAIDTKRSRFVFRFLYAYRDKVQRIPANIPLPNTNRSAMLSSLSLVLLSGNCTPDANTFCMFSGIKNNGFISTIIVDKVNITMNNLSI